MYTNLIKVIQELLSHRQYDTVVDILQACPIETSSNSMDEFIEIYKMCRAISGSRDVGWLAFRDRLKKQMLKFRSQLEIDEVFKRIK